MNQTKETGAPSEPTKQKSPEVGPQPHMILLWYWVCYFLKLGILGFGGPVALVGYMRRDLVEERKWVSEKDYQEGLALAQLSPDPLSAQLAMYLGFLRARILGMTLVEVAFIWPSFALVVALGWFYALYGGLS